MKNNRYNLALRKCVDTTKNIFKSRSLTTQMIVAISLIFLSFFVLQSVLNIVFFKNYYTTKEFQRVNDIITNYVEKMNEPDNDYYDIMYEFTKQNNAYSVIVDGRYFPLRSSATNYTFVIRSLADNSEYHVIVPNNDFEYEIGQTLSVYLQKYNEELYTPLLIVNEDGLIYRSDITCEYDVCTELSGVITNVIKPNNLNYLFDGTTILQNEINKLSSGSIDLSKYEYEINGTTGYWYRSTDGPVSSLVFVHNLKNWNWIVTVVPIVDTTDVINIISNYNYYVYATAVVIIILWSFRISNILTKPIKNIELVAREIASLNFDVKAKEFNSKENESLSMSINLISSNLKATLEALNKKNNELLKLYEKQRREVDLKKQLVSSISHELKTPLMIMHVTIQGIIDGIIPRNEQDLELNNLLKEIQKSSIMIQDMLQIYRLDDPNTNLETNEFNLSSCTLNLLKDFESLFNKHNLILNINLIDDIYIDADESLIKRVISNFITNAIKYTSEGNKIYVEVSKQNNKAYFELTNYGINLEESQIEKIWLPFYRLEHTKKESIEEKGSGIGLYLVSEILKAHKAEFGIINVKNGVKAYFLLPIVSKTI